MGQRRSLKRLKTFFLINENAASQNLWDTVKAELRGEYIL